MVKGKCIFAASLGKSGSFRYSFSANLADRVFIETGAKYLFNSEVGPTVFRQNTSLEAGVVSDPGVDLGIEIVGPGRRNAIATVSGTPWCIANENVFALTVWIEPLITNS